MLANTSFDTPGSIASSNPSLYPVNPFHCRFMSCNLDQKRQIVEINWGILRLVHKALLLSGSAQVAHVLYMET